MQDMDVEIIAKRNNAGELADNWRESYVHLVNLYMMARDSQMFVPGHCYFPYYSEAEHFIKIMDLDKGVNVETREVKP